MATVIKAPEKLNIANRNYVVGKAMLCTIPHNSIDRVSCHVLLLVLGGSNAVEVKSTS